MKSIPLEGEWQYESPFGRGMVTLPACLGGGFFGGAEEPARFTVRFTRTFHLPRRRLGRRAVLILERAGNAAVAVNGRPAGGQIRWCAPHRYDITPFLKAGENKITVEVDSTYSPEGQNGILGMMEIRLFPRVYIRQIEVRDGAVRVLPAGISCGGVTVEVANRSYYQAFGREGWVTVPFDAARLKRWSPNEPNLYRMTCILTTPEGKEVRENLVFGLRNLSVAAEMFCADKTPVFLMGRDVPAPPRVPSPTDPEPWRALFWLQKRHGLNLYVCRGWCPTEAAFQAADETGIYLFVLLPSASCYGGDSGLRQDEGKAALAQFGHHPSLAMLPLPQSCRDSRVLGAGWDQDGVAPGEDVRFAALCEPACPKEWKETLETAQLNPGLGGLLLSLSRFPDEPPAPKGMFGAFRRQPVDLTLREWRSFCSELVLLLDGPRQGAPGKEWAGILWVRSRLGQMADCTIRWRAGGYSGTFRIPLGEGLHQVGKIRFPLPQAPSAGITAELEGTGFQNDWTIQIVGDLP